MDMLVIVIGLILLLILTLKKIPVTLASLVSVLFIILASRMPVLKTLNEAFLAGMANFAKGSWLMIFLGAILSNLVNMSGAARSLAKFIIEKLGISRAIPAIIIAGGILAYGGVSSMVCCFALYPIALSIFRQANLPRYLLPAAIGAGIFTWVTMLPGNPSIVNIVPIQYLGTNAMAAPVVGLVSAVFCLVLTLIYFKFEVAKARRKNLGFESTAETDAVLHESDELEKQGKIPNPLLSLLPILVIALVLNVLKTDISVALLAGIILYLILFYKNMSGLLDCIRNASDSAAILIVTASSIVGIGSVIKAAPGFQKIVEAVLSFSNSGGNPVIIFGLATTLLCGLNASGMGGLSTTLSALGDSFIAMGVNPVVLHRIGVIAATGLDSLPHSGGIVAVLTIAGISYKDGYKHLFITTVVFTLLSLAVGIVTAALLYPIG